MDLTQLVGLIEKKQWDAAWSEYQRLAAQGHGTPRLTLIGSHAAYGLGEYSTARHLAAKALADYRAESDPPKLLGQIRFHYGMVTRYIGDSHIAHQQFQAFLSEVRTRYPELIMGKAKAYHYLGFVLWDRRRQHEAIEALTRSIECCRRDGLQGLLRDDLQNCAWFMCRMGREEEAGVLLEEANGLCESAEDRAFQALAVALYEVHKDKPRSALARCEDVLRKAEAGGPITPAMCSEAAWVAALAAKALGEFDKALQLAEAALRFACTAGEARLMNDANSLKRELLRYGQATS